MATSVNTNFSLSESGSPVVNSSIVRHCSLLIVNTVLFWLCFGPLCHMSFAAVPEASGRHAEGSRKRASATNETDGNKVNAPYIV